MRGDLSVCPLQRSRANKDSRRIEAICLMNHKDLLGRLPNKKALRTNKTDCCQLAANQDQTADSANPRVKPPWVERGDSIGCNCN